MSCEQHDVCDCKYEKRVKAKMKRSQTLESRLAWAEGKLKSASEIITFNCRTNREREWLKDYAAGKNKDD